MGFFGKKRKSEVAPDAPPPPPPDALVADQDYRCNVCIEAVSKGDYMIRCSCKQVFHVSCSAEAEICPKCASRIGCRRSTAGEACPKCSRSIGEGWRWLCTCGASFHLDCAKRLESCMKCERAMDWVDTRRLKVLPGHKTVRMIDEVPCPTCGTAVAKADGRVECICGAVHHLACATRGRACMKCSAPLELAKVGALAGD